MNEKQITQAYISRSLRSQRIPELQQKAQDMIDYFEGKDLPQELQLDKASRVINVPFCVTNQICIMQGHWENPFLIVFVNAYKRLESIKIKLDEQTQ